MTGMPEPHWPLSRLRLRTPHLELRLATPSDLDALASLAADGVHDPSFQPFANSWTDVSPGQRARSVLQWHWTQRGRWQPGDWNLELAVLRDGTVAGSQGLGGRDFAIRREVASGSWLGQHYQGQGIGTEMRAAILQLAFAGLHAGHARTSALTGNAASLAVTRKLGYTPDGFDSCVVRGQRVLLHRYRLDRAAWEAHRTVPVDIEGLDGCLADFGLDDAG
jgi:RimJ/RimL family protein N-acetyltransferase